MRAFTTPSPLVNVMARAAFNATKSLLRDFGEVEKLQVSCKGLGDFVSIADHRAEKAIYDTLRAAYPESNFLMEEGGSVRHGKEESFLWIIDPIDGTNNFLHGVPHCAISIGLHEKKGITAGIIYDPLKDELFWAAKGCGAFLNQSRLRVSSRSSLKDALLAIGGSALKSTMEKNTPMTRLVAESPGIRVTGSLSLDLAYVAAGRYDGCWSNRAEPWDVAAGLILLTEAGGFVTDHLGAAHPLHTKSIVAGNEAIHRLLLGNLRISGDTP